MKTDNGISVTRNLLDTVEYDTANKKLIARYDGCSGITKYAVAGEGDAIVENSWYTVFTINGERLNESLHKEVKNIGRMQIVRYNEHVSTYSYIDDDTNAVLIKYVISNKSKEKIKFGIHFGVEFSNKIDSELMLEYDDRIMALKVKCDNNEFILGCDIAPITYRMDGPRVALQLCLGCPENTSREFNIILTGFTNETEYIGIKDRIDHITDNSIEYANELNDIFKCSDDILNTLFNSCYNCAYTSYKEPADSYFKGFFAGINYSYPLRTYFRDGYWTAQALLPFKPEIIRNEILTLSRGVHDNGECPSAVVAYENDDNTGTYVGHDFWPDHYDSPSFFVMLVYDYICWSGDFKILDEIVDNVSIFNKLRKCIDRLLTFITVDGLMAKPEFCRRDWADNVFRDEYVTYDEILFYRALTCMNKICGKINMEDLCFKYKKDAEALKTAINTKLWDEKNGYYVDYIRTKENFTENHLTIENILAILYDVSDKEKTQKIFTNIMDKLESKNNNVQIYGDWGILSCFPFYKNIDDIIEKSAYLYRYHNGSDWPYWDGIYAMALLINGMPNWKYALSRWWEYSLNMGWYTPVEYYSPVYGRGSCLQAWSSMPAAAMVMGGFGINPDIDGKFEVSLPPWGDCSLNGVKIWGKTFNIDIKDKQIYIVEETNK